MKMLFKSKVLALVASTALLGGTAFVASGSTGAYFSDTHGGTITGTIGSIKLTPDSPTSISFSNLLPGAAQTVTVNYHNSGTSPEDIYLTFPNGTALSALNNLGRYGSVVVASSGWGGNSNVFTSNNLNDRSSTCGPFTNVPPAGSTSGCWPLTSQLLLNSNVPSGQGGTFTFTFEYASAIGGNGPGVWNNYPLPGYLALGQDYATCHSTYPLADCTNNQTNINIADGSGNGLPFNLVATQVGVTPGQVGTRF